MYTTLPIKNLRMRALMTQQELADKLGVNRTALSHYETGRRRVPVSMLPQIRDALGCTWEELFDYETETDGQTDDAR